MTQTPREYLCPKAPDPPPLTGKPVGGSWDLAAWTNDFVDILGPQAPAPRHKTRAKMLWDDQNLYVGAELEEPHLWATLTERESVIFHDNDFEVFIDPDADNHDYFEIEINALNTVWDLRLTKPYRDGGKPLTEWDAVGMRTAVHLDGTLNDPTDQDRGWSVVLAIPFSSMAPFCAVPCPPRSGDLWRVNFSRVQWLLDVVEGKYVKRPNVPEDNWVWSPQGVVDMHQPETWGYVRFADSPQEPFNQDRDKIERQSMLLLYKAQREFQKRTGEWCLDAAVLGFQGAILQPTPEGFIAGLPCPSGTLRMTQDSRTWIDPAIEG